MYDPSLSGRRVLVVEDEYFIVEDLRRSLEANGASVIGPVNTIEDAVDQLEQAKTIDGAVLDINLQGDMAYPIADVLAARGVPFVFATGYDRLNVPPRFAAICRCEKPVDAEQIVELLLASAASKANTGS
jgi:CheY-like chemotaxis protein